MRLNRHQTRRLILAELMNTLSEAGVGSAIGSNVAKAVAGSITPEQLKDEAEKHFKKAIEYGLSMSTDLAMAKMSLAGILMQKRRKREAQQLLTEAKKLDKHNMLSEQMKMIQQQMKRI